MSDEVDLMDVGYEMAASLRHIFHFACRYNDKSQRAAALLFTFILLDTLKEEVVGCLDDECADAGLDVDDLLSRVPDVTIEMAENFIADVVMDHSEPKPIAVNQSGVGKA